MAKHRETIFCVVRTRVLNEEDDYGEPIICSATQSLERAEELKGQYELKFSELGFDIFKFTIQTTTFYDE